MAAAVGPGADRRDHVRRRPGGGSEDVVCRIRPGHEARVLDLSAGGALLETARRLGPGAVIELHIDATSGRHSTRASILRSVVAVLRSDLVLYRAAVRFDRTMPATASDGPAASQERPGR